MFANIVFVVWMLVGGAMYMLVSGAMYRLVDGAVLAKAASVSVVNCD